MREFKWGHYWSLLIIVNDRAAAALFRSAASPAASPLGFSGGWKFGSSRSCVASLIGRTLRGSGVVEFAALAATGVG
jgi:hypothetical protein